MLVAGFTATALGPVPVAIVAVTHWAWGPGAANNRTAKTAETTATIFFLERLRIAVLASFFGVHRERKRLAGSVSPGGLDHGVGVEPHVKRPPSGRNGIDGHSPMPFQRVAKLDIFTGFFPGFLHLLPVRFSSVP